MHAIWTHYDYVPDNILAAILPQFSFFFFFNDTATTEIYTLSLHDALPISHRRHHGAGGDVDAGEWLDGQRSEEHTSELQSRVDLVCRLLLEKKKNDGARREVEESGKDIIQADDAGHYLMVVPKASQPIRGMGAQRVGMKRGYLFFFLMIRRPPRSTLFPTRRSSDLQSGYGVAAARRSGLQPAPALRDRLGSA